VKKYVTKGASQLQASGIVCGRAQHREAGQLSLHLRQRLAGDSIHDCTSLCTRQFLLAGKIEGHSNLLNGETPVAGVQGESNTKRP
jgi:hypothetical protein